MWHFRKGQPLRLGCPSIFITSPLVIWKLAAPIFVSPPVAGCPSHPPSRPNLASSLRLFPSVPLLSFFIFWDACHVIFFLAKTRRSSILFVLTRKKLSLWGAGETRFNTHIHRASGVPRGVRGPHVNTSCEDGGDREKG